MVIVRVVGKIVLQGGDKSAVSTVSPILYRDDMIQLHNRIAVIDLTNIHFMSIEMKLMRSYNKKM